MNYLDYVTSARELLQKIESHQYKIAEMALSVCQIRHGGKSDKFYTISDFADDIGMNRKTLSQWIQIYRDVLLRIDIKKPTEEEWSTGSKTANILKSQRTVDNGIEGKPGSLGAYKKKIPKDSIAKIFNDILDGNTESVKFERIFTSTRYNKTLLSEIDLDLVDQHKLLRVMQWLDEASDFINEHLTKKSKQVAS